MDPTSTRSTPLGPLASDALAQLESPLQETEGMRPATAREMLQDHGFAEAETDVALTQLLSRAISTKSTSSSTSRRADSDVHTGRVSPAITPVCIDALW